MKYVLAIALAILMIFPFTSFRTDRPSIEGNWLGAIEVSGVKFT